ncbi:YoaK family protein [Actinoplanes solisilvae]|uniref:YoaK family protein n=1 Tax=Actinoplanes solisilvae TaxID=2486853 RepID=UPI000FDC2306|nr:YoaK family protein [Actinoplanes solisilvae]
MARWNSRQAGTLALAGCAGAVDLLAITALSGTFVSVITGNLVIFGYGLGQPEPSRLIAVGIAVPTFALGVLLWTRLSKPGAVRVPLLAEWLLMAVFAVVLLVVDVHPHDTVARVLLGLAGVAMGGQSVIAIRLKVSTTYMTGNLTTALAQTVTGHARQAWPAYMHLLALLAGAAAAAALYVHLNWAAPVLPPLLLAVAIALLPARQASPVD